MEARAPAAKELEEKIVSFLARQAEFERRAAFGVADQSDKMTYLAYGHQHEVSQLYLKLGMYVRVGLGGKCGQASPY